MEILEREAWTARAAAHVARVDAYVQPHVARRKEREAHPVFDFLFTYYAQRPAQLRRWHPGYGIGLLDASEYDGLKGYAGDPVRVSQEYVRSFGPLVDQLRRLLVATASRPGNFGCFGMHEWAMVYRLAEEETRHAAWPLRLGQADTDAVVESHRIACSHFDAFRFFTPPAVPLNALSPRRDDRPEFEQPGCLHAGMDLYKHAFRLTPMIPSELVADCFELAWDIRVLDMRAAPYDLTGLDLGSNRTWSPVKVETPEGKQEYAGAQRAFAERAAPLRQQLIAWCDRLLAV